MADVFTKKKRSEVMGRIRSKNTKPEILVRKFLHSRGFRFRLHNKILPGKPDIVLNKHNTIVLINGCFWHGHKNCKIFKMPKTRQNYWKPKIENNIRKDLLNRTNLQTLGWNVIVVWECQLKKKKLKRTLNKIVDKILTT